MLSKFFLLRLFSHPFHRSNTTAIVSLQQFLHNSFCIVADASQATESPDLPNWFKYSENRDPQTANSEDDFVIPCLATWVESHNFINRSKLPTQILSNVPETGVEKICKILQQRFPSPENVAQALDGCGLDVSQSLVEQLLRRYSNDWISAFGVFIWAKGQTDYRHSEELYNTMVDVLGKSRNFKLMWELVDEMDQRGGLVSLITMTKVMRRLAKDGKYEDAIKTFKGMGKYGLKIDSNSLNVLLDALVKENSVERAHNVFLEFKDMMPLNCHTFNVLIHGWCKARKFDDAQKVMNEMQRHGFKPNVVSYTSFIEAYCREKDFRKVDAVLNEMEQKGCKPNVVTYTILMHSYGKAKQIKKALGVYEKMKQDGCDPDTSFYSSLIYSLGKAGRLKDALEIFNDMKKQGVVPDVLTYNTLIASASEHSQEENALQLLKKMDEDSCKPDLKTYAPLLKMCCRKKWMKVLYFLLNHMFKHDVSIELGTYTLLVHGLCKSGKLEHACSFFEEMVSKRMTPKDCTYKLLVEKLEARSMEKAKQGIERLTQEAKAQETVPMPTRPALDSCDQQHFFPRA